MVRQDLQRSALGPDYSMEVYVDGRHAKIGRGHKVALIGAHARNQDGIGHCIKSAVVTNSEVRDLGQFSLVANPKFLRHFFLYLRRLRFEAKSPNRAPYPEK